MIAYALLLSCNEVAFEGSDMNGDGLVNLVDFATLAANFTG